MEIDPRAPLEGVAKEKYCWPDWREGGYPRCGDQWEVGGPIQGTVVTSTLYYICNLIPSLSSGKLSCSLHRKRDCEKKDEKMKGWRGHALSNDLDFVPRQPPNRYIEIFRSSLSEVRVSIGLKMRAGPMATGGFNQRPSPYDRNDRFGGMNRFNNNGRNARTRGVEREKCKELVDEEARELNCRIFIYLIVSAYKY